MRVQKANLTSRVRFGLKKVGNLINSIAVTKTDKAVDW